MRIRLLKFQRKKDTKFKKFYIVYYTYLRKSIFITGLFDKYSKVCNGNLLNSPVTPYTI